MGQNQQATENFGQPPTRAHLGLGGFIFFPSRSGAQQPIMSLKQVSPLAMRSHHFLQREQLRPAWAGHSSEWLPSWVS